MLRHASAILLTATLVMACEQTEAPNQKASSTAPTQTSSEGRENRPEALPAASPEDVVTEWQGDELLSEIDDSRFVGVVKNDGYITLVRNEDGEDVALRRTSGARLTLRAPKDVDLSGMELEIKTTARASDGGEQPFRVAFSTNRKGHSDWQDFLAGDEFATYSFTYVIPDGIDTTYDYIGFSVPDSSEVDIQSVAINVIG